MLNVFYGIMWSDGYRLTDVAGGRRTFQTGSHAAAWVKSQGGGFVITSLKPDGAVGTVAVVHADQPDNSLKSRVWAGPLR